MPFIPRIIGLFLIPLLFSLNGRAQDTLPRFSATARGTGKILISWHNKFPTVSQISIQRSTDSLKNFTTLLTVPDPKLPENGAVDTKAPHPNFYYRLFIVLENGNYLFTPSRRPGSNTGVSPVALKEDKEEEDTQLNTANTRILFISPSNDKGKAHIQTPSAIHGTHNAPEIEATSTIVVRKKDAIIGTLTSRQLETFRDSILTKTKDTLVYIDGDTLAINPFVPKEVYKVSPFVYIGRLGNIHISLPEAPKKHFSVRFFDDNNRLLFEVSEIHDTSLILDKVNFQHAGWFRFELYDGDQLKEKNKLLIPL